MGFTPGQYLENDPSLKPAPERDEVRASQIGITPENNASVQNLGDLVGEAARTIVANQSAGQEIVLRPEFKDGVFMGFVDVIITGDKGDATLQRTADSALDLHRANMGSPKIS